MDLQLALAKLDPTYEYVLNHSQNDGLQKILFWRGPDKQPTADELDLAWDDCLEEKAAADLAEFKREEAIERVKVDPVMVDIVEVLRL